jgi:hypothetical protein
MKFHFTHKIKSIGKNQFHFSHVISSDNFSASEPNLLKIRIKQNVIDRKARGVGVMARRQERILLAHQRRLQKQVAMAQATSSM